MSTRSLAVATALEVNDRDTEEGLSGIIDSPTANCVSAQDALKVQGRIAD